MSNDTSNKPDLTKLRDDKCEPAALEMFNILAKYQPNFTAKDRDSITKHYEPIAKEILELFLAKDMTVSESNYTVSIFMTAFDYTRNLVVQSLQHNFELAQQKLFHAHKTDIRLKAIDQVLKDETVSDESSDTPDYSGTETDVLEEEKASEDFKPEPVESEVEQKIQE